MDDFIKQFNGSSLEFNHDQYESQCVDLAQCWENWNDWPLIRGNAKDQPNYMDKNFYEFIPNSLTAVPQKGDLVIWGMAPYGHIAIFVEGNALSFRSFDQNWPSDLRCRIINHTYKNVIGWIRPKENEMVTDESLKDAIQFDGDSRVYFWAGNPDIAKRWYGDSWGKYVRQIKPTIIEKPYPVEVIKDNPEQQKKIEELSTKLDDVNHVKDGYFNLVNEKNITIEELNTRIKNLELENSICSSKEYNIKELFDMLIKKIIEWYKKSKNK